MECKDFRLNISAYMDNMLEEEERKHFLGHLEQCQGCRIDYENVKMIIESVQEIEEVELPQHFTETFRSKLEMEAKPKEDKAIGLMAKKKWTQGTKILTGVAAGLAILLLSLSLLNNPDFRGMKTGSTEERAYIMDDSVKTEEVGMGRQSYGIAADIASPSLHMALNREESVKPMTEIEESQVHSGLENRMRIKRGRLRIEVENFDEVYEAILGTIDAQGGYIQNSETYQYGYGRVKPDQNLRYAHMTLRVPSQSFLMSYEALKGLGKVTHHAMDEEDITERYRDIENEVKNLQVQEERLRELFQRGERIEDLLKIENELSRIRLQINSLMGNLKNYDHLVSMATIQLEIQEVEKEELRLRTLEEGFWNKAKNSFIHSVNNILRLSQELVIGIFGGIPFLAIVAPLAFLAVKVYKRFKIKGDA